MSIERTTDPPTGEKGHDSREGKKSRIGRATKSCCESTRVDCVFFSSFPSFLFFRTTVVWRAFLLLIHICDTHTHTHTHTHTSIPMRTRKCIPGLFCIENMTLFMLVVIATILAMIFWNQQRGSGGIGVGGVFDAPSSFGSSSSPPLYLASSPMIDGISGGGGVGWPTSPDNNDPLTPPENRLYDPTLPLATNRTVPPGRVPVNVDTRSPGGVGPRQYTQIGILTPAQSKTKSASSHHQATILPLYGQSLDSRRGKMRYYTMAGGGGGSKLPVSRNGKSCTGEYGCDEISNGDTVYVQGYEDIFKATVYENSQFYYL